MWRLSLVLTVSVLSGCDECRTAADCDDGIFCNGEEHCGGLFGPCGLSSPTNSEFACSCSTLAYNPCSNPTPVCNELDDTCNGCTAAADCDDGIDCTDDACDASTGECINDRVDANCGEGEVCFVSLGQCVPGDCVNLADCTEPTPVCDHRDGRMVCVPRR